MTFRTPATALLLALFLWTGTAAAERTVILVANERCPMAELSNIDIRKAYLGVTVRVDGRQLRPLRWTGDAELNRVFYQAIVAMSEKSYERRALSLALKFGTPRPLEFDSLEQALDTLRRTPCGILFGWAEDVVGQQNLQEIKTLWRGN